MVYKLSVKLHITFIYICNIFFFNLYSFIFIKAYKNKEEGSVKSSDKHFEAEVNYNFTDNKSDDVLLYMYGHTHKDSCDIYDNITVVGTKNILGPLGNTDKNWGDPAFRIDGNWDCVLIDKKKRIMNIRRYGIEGFNRRIEL